MGKKNLLRILAFLFLLTTFSSCKSDVTVFTWDEIGLNTDSEIKHGIPAYDKTVVDYKKEGKSVFKVTLEKPVIIDIASKPEGWGYFQFPNISSDLNGNTIVTWSLAEDAVTAYGKGNIGMKKSIDKGKTWKEGDKNAIYGGIQIPNGDIISIHTPVAVNVKELDLGEPIYSAKETYGRTMTFYRYRDIPAELQGIYLKRKTKDNPEWQIEHNVLNDSNLVRQTDSGMFPVVWWGDIKVESDSSLIAVTYPAIYEEGDSISLSTASAYISYDYGKTWNIRGRIPYHYDPILDKNGNKRTVWAYTEPAFEILEDGTYLTILRTTDGLGNSPMYASISKDKGKTWTQPEAITRAGVLPRLLQLENGTLVMSSGRPGVQLRFSTDGKGLNWTDPFEMLYFKNEEEVSCGYTGLLPISKNSFLIVYSDFKYLNEKGEMRKAIKVREVKVTEEKYNSKSNIDISQQNKNALQILRNNMYTQKEWIKVHAAEFLLWSGFPEGVEEHFLEEEKNFGEQSPYRIGIWRVLAQVAKTSDEKKRWSDKIMRAFVDESGKDRIHAAETLAKLKISPLNDYPEITKQAMESSVKNLSLYTIWSIAFTSGNTFSDSLHSFLKLAVSKDKDVADRNLAAYRIRQSINLEEDLWNPFAQSVLLEPRDSEVRINLLNAAFVTVPASLQHSKLFKQVREEFLEYEKTKDYAVLIKLADGLAEKGEPKDVPKLLSFMETKNTLNDAAYEDFRSYAAYAIIKINNRKRI
jgi:hypothetical protein